MVPVMRKESVMPELRRTEKMENGRGRRFDF
jgi:hypothetical protein